MKISFLNKAQKSPHVHTTSKTKTTDAAAFDEIHLLEVCAVLSRGR